MNSGIASKDIFAKDAERRTEQFVVVVFIVIGIATTLRFAFHFSDIERPAPSVCTVGR